LKVGVPKEIKNHEYRVGMTPAAVHTVVGAGHTVLVERGAGEGSSIADAQYREAGAELLPDADAVWAAAELVVKVKEPIEAEYERLRAGQTLFTYLHLAPLPALTDALLAQCITGIAYETITDGRGGLPLLTPMSEVAGRMAVIKGAHFLDHAHGGRGTLISGVPGVPPGDVVIIGGGIVGLNAAKMAVGLGARVTVLETNLERLRFLDNTFAGAIQTLASNPHNLVSAIQRADVLIGAVLIPGASAPTLVTREMLKLMKPGSVIVDVAVDQGGCFETTRPTTHSEPTYVVDGIVHYCVANMPGAVPRTSTYALNNATLPYTLALVGKGVAQAVRDDAGLYAGVNTYAGHITCRPVAESQGREFRELGELL
jgi:alanine dehydrogenase